MWVSVDGHSEPTLEKNGRLIIGKKRGKKGEKEGRTS